MTPGGLAMAVLPDEPVVGDVSGWSFFILGLLATIAGSLLFGVATNRPAALPRSGATLLGAPPRSPSRRSSWPSVSGATDSPS